MNLQVIEEPKRRGPKPGWKNRAEAADKNGMPDMAVVAPEVYKILEETLTEMPPKIERYRMQLDPAFDNWLLNRLEQTKTWYGRAGWLGQIRQAIASNDWLMLRLNGSIFMGAVHKDPLDPRVRIQEFICWSMDENPKDCMKLYRDIRKRAHEMNAVCVNLGRDSDVSHGDIKHDLNGDYPADVFLDMTK